MGTRPTESGTTTPSLDPHPDRTARAESRGALRAQRRQRRRIAIGCAVLIALCVLITLVIVDIARDPTSAPQSGPLTRGAVVHNDLLSASSTRPPIPPAPRRR